MTVVSKPLKKPKARKNKHSSTIPGKPLDLLRSWEQIQGLAQQNKSLASIKEEMQKTINGINQDLQIIERFPNDTDTLKARYLMTLDLATVFSPIRC